MSKAIVAIRYTSINDKTAAQALAEKLNLPVIENLHKSEGFDYILDFTPQGLQLTCCKKSYKPIFINFTDPSLHYRLSRASKHSELLAKAIGIKKSSSLRVLDTTAGLGQDSILMAALGCKVHLLERSAIIAALLQDALERARLADISYAKAMTLSVTDAIQFMQTQKQLSFDVVYLDPMYPDLKQTAAVKKEMQILRDIVGTDQDVETLFSSALSYAQQRVVVKRPRLAPFLLNKTPDICFKGASSRFDVYLIQRKIIC
jgi:16S rRNA (guanine1516-N2)-methyltransferase